jgi:hypothetical protein
VRLGVHAPELVPRRVSRRGEAQARLEAGFPKAAPQRVEPLRPLGMPGPGVVLPKDRIVVEENPAR